MTIELDEDMEDVPFGAPPPRTAITAVKGDMIEVESARAEQETQAGFIVAKRYPRDEESAVNRIIQACNRKTLAEQAEYAYSRAGTQITGPSIRLAEVIAQAWGNVAFGIRELQTAAGLSMMQAYCYDMETNTRTERIFYVKHERKAQGQIKRLEDPRDVYEMTANQGARRLRSCILQIIPGDVVELAQETCRATLDKAEGKLKDRIPKMLEGFAAFGVTRDMIEKKLGKNAEAILPSELVTLRGIFTSLKDGMSVVSDWFEPTTTEKLKEKLQKAGKPVEAPQTAPEPEPPQDTPEPVEAIPEPQAPQGSDSEPVQQPPPIHKPDNEDRRRTSVLLAVKMAPRGGRPSAWQLQYEGLYAQGLKILQGMEVDDPEFNFALGMLELIKTYGANDIDSLDVMNRPKLKRAMQEFVDSLGEEPPTEPDPE